MFSLNTSNEFVFFKSPILYQTKIPRKSQSSFSLLDQEEDGSCCSQGIVFFCCFKTHTESTTHLILSFIIEIWKKSAKRFRTKTKTSRQIAWWVFWWRSDERTCSTWHSTKRFVYLCFFILISLSFFKLSLGRLYVHDFLFCDNGKRRSPKSIWLGSTPTPARRLESSARMVNASFLGVRWSNVLEINVVILGMFFVCFLFFLL